MTGSDLKSSTIKSLFWKLFEQGGAAVITLVVQIVLARILAPDEFGMLAIMLVFVNVGNVIVQSGLNTAVIQAPDVTERDYSTAFWMSLAISVALYAVVFLVAPLISGFYSMPAAVEPLRVLVLVLIVNSYNSIQEAIVARNFEFQKTFRATVTAGMVSGAAGIVIALVGGGIWALVVQQLLYQLCKCFVLAFQIPWKPRLVFDRSRAVVLFRFGWKLLVSGLMDQGYQSLSDLIIGKMFNSADLGFVSQGKRYPQALGVMLDGAIQPVMLSAVAHVQEQKDQVKRLARRALKTSTFLIVPSMALFAILAEPLVVLLLGEKWLPCVPFLQMYCFIYALQPIHTTNLQVLNGVGRSDLFLKLEVVKKVIGLGVMCFAAFVLRDLYAIVGGYMLVGVVCTFVNAAPNKKVIGYSYWEQVRDICPAFALSLAAGAVVFPLGLLALPGIAIIALQAFAMLAAYALLAKLFHVEQLSYLLNTLREVKARRTGK
ncbi:lipopolysaccharide biosynthesis protein [Gordonibacter massiliensis (ex Traore et al. 2017)]|uniref:lipopolysaccharide biosynthesis protein n=1 Tax=Gordonibacter massiliensis (ex Traore et al. 2017) TaxID=1841863 RepID=UPI001C8BCC92|nr:lipopolysaccharide biosynthesis protein [Gordonibacter massiliensis (ex Traore et al. 2017)]MBX9033625.1 lipopolysaccharide biosynthesis protein [Gordonibacter massiliensis (ex Traore et al. 2017)]